MARQGDNIHKRKSDGRWESRCLYFDKILNRKKYRYFYGKSYKEASDKREKFLHRGCMDKLEKPLNETLSFKEAAMEWLAAIKESSKQSTYVKYSMIYGKYLKETVDDILLADFVGSDVSKKIFDYSFTNLSDSLKKSICCVMNQILKYVSQHYSMELPLLKCGKTSHKTKPTETFTKREQSALFSSLENNMDLHKMAISLSIQTGMRIGEICSLKWEDIDLEHRTIRVNRTVQRLAVENGQTKTALVETAPKSLFSKREIPVTQSVISMFVQSRHAGAYVFGGDKPMEPRTLQNRFKKLLHTSGIRYRNFHVLRHTFATNCIANGMDVKSLSEILGHANVNITLNRYVHPSMDTKRGYTSSQRLPWRHALQSLPQRFPVPPRAISHRHRHRGLRAGLPFPEKNRNSFSVLPRALRRLPFCV